MTTKDLFRCIGNLSDGMIEEATDIRRKPRWLPIAALAACAVLAISIPLAVRSANSTKSASTADTSAAETPAAEAPAEAPAETDSAVGATESPREPEASGGWEDSNPIAARILSTELGGLRLGMKREDVRAMLGEPDSTNNAGEIQREDGVWEVCWFYHTSDSADVLYDLRLRFTNTGMRDGSGWVLSKVWAQSPCDWTLDTGIGIGSPQEAVDAAYPDAVWTHETMIENDQEIPYDLYELTSGDLFMLIRVEAGEVSHISFGGLNAYHFWDKNEPAPADPYTFTPYDTLSGGTVTAYTRTEDGWAQQVLTEKRAKLLVTAFNIMAPEPSDTQGEPIVWLQFESGGVAALYDETGTGAIYRLEDPSAFEAALAANEDPTPALTLIESCVFPDVWDNVQQALEQ
ncbi:MAG: hypothetical protein MSA04_08860 [Clostridiales bacterium]|nr:hypothetical protein [Clostridiales bacterium]